MRGVPRCFKDIQSSLVRDNGTACIYGKLPYERCKDCRVLMACLYRSVAVRRRGNDQVVLSHVCERKTVCQ